MVFPIVIWEAAGAEDRHLRGRAGLSSEWDRGEAPLSERGRVWPLHSYGSIKLLLTVCSLEHEHPRVSVGNGAVKPQTENFDNSSAWDGS